MADPITQPVNTLPTDASPQADDTVLTVKTTDGSLVRVALSDIKSLFSIPAASSATPANLGTAAAGSSGDFARADHVHNKPTYSKSDVGLGNVDNVQQYSATNPPPYPVTSVNGQTGAVSLSIPSSAGDVGAVAVAQGVGHSGEFLVVGSDGNVTTVTLSAWQGGNY